MFLENEIISNPHLYKRYRKLSEYLLIKKSIASGSKLKWNRRPGFLEEWETPTWEEEHFTGTVADWYTVLVKKVEIASENIFSKTGNHVNFIVASPEIVSILEMTNQFRAPIVSDICEIISNVGTLNSNIIIFCDPYFNRYTLFLGFEETLKNSHSPNLYGLFLASRENKKTDPNNYGTITIVGL